MYLVLYIREFQGILGSRSSPLDIQTRVSTCLPSGKRVQKTIQNPHF